MNQVVERHRVRQVLQRAGVAMLVTLDNCGGHHGRPLLPLWLQGDPNIYFLTHKDSRKVVQIGERPQVALTVSSAFAASALAGGAVVTRGDLHAFAAGSGTLMAAIGDVNGDGRPDLVVAIQIEEGTPTVLRVGHIEMPVTREKVWRAIQGGKVA